MLKPVRRKRVVEFGGLGDTGETFASRLYARAEKSNPKLTYVGLGRTFLLPERTRRALFIRRFGDVHAIPYSFRSNSVNALYYHMVAPSEKFNRAKTRELANEWWRVLKEKGRVYLTYELKGGIFQKGYSERGFEHAIEPLMEILKTHPFRLRFFLSQSSDSGKQVSTKELVAHLKKIQHDGISHQSPHIVKLHRQKVHLLRSVTEYSPIVELMVILSKPTDESVQSSRGVTPQKKVSAAQ